MTSQTRDSASLTDERIYELAKECADLFVDTWGLACFDMTITQVELFARAIESEVLSSRDAESAGTGWMPIETAPKDGMDILFYAPPYEYDGRPVLERVTVGHWHHDEGGTYEHRDLDGRWIDQEDRAPFDDWITWDGGFLSDFPPTHWMPLPPAPGQSFTATPERGVPLVRKLSDKDIEQIAGTDELTGDAILDFAHRLLNVAVGASGVDTPLRGIDGPRNGPVADGSQTPNDAAANPCAKAGSTDGVGPSNSGSNSSSDAPDREQL